MMNRFFYLSTLLVLLSYNANAQKSIQVDDGIELSWARFWKNGGWITTSEFGAKEACNDERHVYPTVEQNNCSVYATFFNANHVMLYVERVQVKISREESLTSLITTYSPASEPIITTDSAGNRIIEVPFSNFQHAELQQAVDSKYRYYGRRVGISWPDGQYYYAVGMQPQHPILSFIYRTRLNGPKKQINITLCRLGNC